MTDPENNGSLLKDEAQSEESNEYSARSFSGSKKEAPFSLPAPGEGISKQSPRRTTNPGPGLPLTPPGASNLRSDASGEKKETLAERLRRLAKNQENSLPAPLAERQAPPPQEARPASSKAAPLDELHSPKAQKSTLLMHNAASIVQNLSESPSSPPLADEDYDDLPSDTDRLESTQLLDISAFEEDLKEDLQESTAPGHEALLEEDDFEEEKTQLSPGLEDLAAQDEKVRKPPGSQKSTDPEFIIPLSPGPSSQDGLFPSSSLPSPAPAGPPEEQAHAPAPAIQEPMADEDQDDEFDVEHTELFASPFENDPICPRLSALEGPAAGQEFLLNKSRNSVGRATNNVVVIPDLSMSRKHFEIVQQTDESYALKDLMAVNGTTLNGTKIREADLFHGDRIEAGKSIFQFIIPGDVPVDTQQRRLIPAAVTKTANAQSLDELAPLTAPPPKAHTFDRLLMTITIVAAVLCVPLMGFVVYQALNKGSASTAPGALAPDLYLEGVAALQQREWEQAERLFQESFALDPSFGEVPAQLERISRERRTSKILARAEEHEGSLPESIISELQSISDESVYYDRAQSLLRLARQDRAHALLGRAHRAYERGDLEEARSALEELTGFAPQHEGAQRLQIAMEEGIPAEEVPEPEPPAEETAPEPSTPRRTASTRPAPQERTPPPRRSAQSDDLADPFADPAPTTTRSSGSGVVNFTEGFTLYRDGRFDAALSHFESIVSNSTGAIAGRASSAASDVRQFRDSMAAARSAISSGSFSSARAHLDRARSADRSLAGGSGYFADTIAELMANSFAAEGLQQLEAGNYASAFNLLVQAESHRPRESTTRQLSRALESQANSLYIRAANQRLSDPEGAAELCRTILTMVPTSSDTHRRARQMLNELQ